MIRTMTILALLLFSAQSLALDDLEQVRFKPIRAQFIAALGESTSASGTINNDWAIWKVDPGPRGVWLRDFEKLQAREYIAPAGWEFDPDSFWIDENGLLMEKPEFSIEPGHYLVTGERELVTVLSVHEKESDGSQRWELADGTLDDVTHLPCRSARYTQGNSDKLLVVSESEGEGGDSCSPADAPLSAFKVPPGSPMPSITGCIKQDFRVLIVVGLPTGTVQ